MSGKRNRANKTRPLKKAALLLALIFTACAGTGMLAGCNANGAQPSAQPVAGPVIDGKEAYHVIVAGGEPEGFAAAIAAARNGMRTLLVEKGDALGGLMTLGMLNFLDMNEGPNGELLTRGIFQEFYQALGNAFDVEEAKTWFLKKCADEPNLTVMLNTEIVRPIMDGDTITGLELKEYGAAPELFRSLTVIDATVDGDVAAAAGAPYTVGGEDRGAHGIKQGVTLVFELSGVNWDAVYNYLKNDGNPNTGADMVCAWGYGEEVKDYVTLDGNMRFRGPNIARQKKGDNVLLNALIIFGVDALDPDSYAEGIERGRREIENIVRFVRDNFVGFENAVFESHASRLYVRETRHFIGEYRLTITDVLENRDHWDRIGHGSYPVDLQASGINDYGNCIGNPDIYSIPFRCLVPLQIEQLLITGRSASYDSLPHGSARVMPVGMVTGEACGTAVAYSVEHGVAFRQMAHDADAVLWLQNQLKKQGAYLVEFSPPVVAVMEHWAYPGVAVMRELGMIEGGYSNDYRLETRTGSRWGLQVRINHVMAVVNERTAVRGDGQIPLWATSIETDDVTVGLVFVTAAGCASIGDARWLSLCREGCGSIGPMPFSGAAEARDYLIERGVLDESALVHYPDYDEIASMGQLLFVLGSLYTALMAG